MGVVLYKGKQAQVFDEYSYLHMLDAGWSYSPDEEDLKAKEAEEKEAAEARAEKKAEDKKDRDKQAAVAREGVLLEKIKKGNASNNEVKEYAKLTKIKGWHLKGIDKLIKEIMPEE